MTLRIPLVTVSGLTKQIQSGDYAIASSLGSGTTDSTTYLRGDNTWVSSIPIGTISGLAAGIATWLATPSSANLLAAVTDETGTGALVFANTPTLVTPVIGAATGTSLAISGLLSAANGWFTGRVAPASGTGAEIFADSGNAWVLGYNRTGSVFVPLKLDGSVIDFHTGTVLRGSITSTGLNNTAIGATTPSTLAATTGVFTGALTQSGGYALLGSYNASGVYPTAGTALGVGWNFGGGIRDISLWNTDTAAVYSFYFRQQTGASSHTDLMVLGASGAVGFGTLYPNALIDSSVTAFTRTSWGVGGAGLALRASLYTDSSTAAAGTAASNHIHAIATPTLAATNTTVTTTTAATLYIAGAPSAGTNMTITNPYAIHVASGNVHMASGKLSINNTVLGGNSLDVYTTAAGTTAAFQSNGLTNGDSIASFNGGNSVTGSIKGTSISATCTADLISYIQQNGAGNATFQALVLGAGDAKATFGINGGQAWGIGLDNSDSDSFKISGSASLGTSDYLTITTAGAASFASTVSGAFNGTLGATTPNSVSATTITASSTINAAGDFRLSGFSFYRVAVPATGVGWVGGYNTTWDSGLGVVHDSTGTQSAILYSTSSGIVFYASASQAANSVATTVGSWNTTGLSLGSVAAAASLDINVNRSASSWTTSGIGIRVRGNTYTDSSTAASGTAVTNHIHAIAAPALAATNATVTTTTAATLYIAGAPTAGTNMTITRPYALQVGAGNSQFTGKVGIGEGTYALAPTQYLDVCGAMGTGGGTGIRLQNTTAAGFSEIVFNNDTFSSSGLAVIGIGGSGAGGFANLAYFYNRQANDMVFGTTNTERFRISAAGAATFTGTVAGAFNGTLGATTPNTGAFTTLTANGAVTFTANTTSTSTTTGTLIVTGGVGISGALNATTKSFVIPHPTKPNMLLRYGSLEGPENGVYVRGELTGGNVIELPEYWTKLVSESSITVTLTPKGKAQALYVDKIENNKIYIKTGKFFNSEISCYYLIHGERRDVEKLLVEIRE